MAKAKAKVSFKGMAMARTSTKQTRLLLNLTTSGTK